MKKATWYYPDRVGAEEFDRDLRNMARCGVSTALVSGGEQHAAALAAPSRSASPEIHVCFGFEALFQAATGRKPPRAVPARPDEYRAMFPPSRKPDGALCWSSLAETATLAAYLRAYARERRYLKGVQVDALRFTNTVWQETNPCQCDGCAQRRQPWLGRGELTPEDLRDPSIVYKEVETRVRLITAAARAIAEAVRGEGLKFSIAARAVYAGRDAEFNPPPTWGYGPAIFEGQDWAGWCRDGLLDEIHFMNYSVRTDRFERLARRHAALLSGCGVISYEGIGVSSSAGQMSPEILKDQLGLVKSLGIAGATVFYWNKMKDEHMQVLERA